MPPAGNDVNTKILVHQHDTVSGGCLAWPPGRPYQWGESVLCYLSTNAAFEWQAC
jgi:hypothetical protein